MLTSTGHGETCVQIETLKEECAAIRMKCSVIRSQIRPPNPKLRQTFQDKESSEDVSA